MTLADTLLQLADWRMVDPARVEAFWAKVDRRGPDECWPWQGAIGRRADSGYGYVSVGASRNIGAHRVSFALAGKQLPQGHHIDHLCRNRVCVNPAHLEAVTPRENTLRGNGASARNARKTHCIRGHSLSGDNLYVWPNGWRSCRLCKNEECKRRRARAKAANGDG